MVISCYKVRNYKVLMDKFDEWIRYAAKNSDRFSVISFQKKPYDQRPPHCLDDRILQTLQPFLQRQLVNVREWAKCSVGSLDDPYVSDDRYVMSVYTSCRRSADILIQLGSQMLTEDAPPVMDLCFYRRDVEWISTLSFDSLAWISTDSKDDLEFFTAIGIELWDEGADEPFRIPPEGTYL